jgi:cyclophilin family peptidyl-prolyl cis-trans isomerase
MASTPTPAAQGTQAPSQIELLWERYKSFVSVIILVAFGALGAKYAYTKYNQGKVDAAWSSFTEALGMQDAFTDENKYLQRVTERLATVEMATIKAALATAPDAQKPYLDLALARKAILDKDWDAAEAALREIETKYPNHVLCKTTSHPVQVQDVVKEDDDPKQMPGKPPKKQTYKPAVEGSSVSLVRAQIAEGKAYTAPLQFAKPELPADGVKVKFELSGGYGSFTIMLLADATTHLREAFLKLAEKENTQPFWVGLAVDEIHRPTKTLQGPRELHLGFDSTKEEDRAKWNTSEASKNTVEFEKNKLSHFAGAVSARTETDGKACADRFWIAVDDAPSHDGDRVIFGYVCEGLDNLKKVCEAAMATSQEEDRGQGKPSENIRVTAVTVIKP